MPYLDPGERNANNRQKQHHMIGLARESGALLMQAGRYLRGGDAK